MICIDYEAIISDLKNLNIVNYSYKTLKKCYFCKLNQSYKHNTFTMKKTIFPLFVALIVCITCSSLFAQSTTTALKKQELSKNHYDPISLIANSFEARSNSESDLHFYEQKDKLIRYKKIELSRETKTLSSLNEGKRYSINLFEDADYKAIVQRTDVNINGTRSVTLKLDDYEYAFMVISTTRDRSLGNLYIPEKNKYYHITSDPETKDHYLIELAPGDRDQLVPEPKFLPVPEKSSGTPEDFDEIDSDNLNGSINTKEENPANIDVMIVYTPAAKSWANSNGGGISNVMAQAMEWAQISLENSETLMTMRLVHSAELDYEESGDSSTDLYRFSFHSGYDPYEMDPGRFIDEIHDWRNEYGADLNSIFTVAHDTGGVGWLLSDKYGSPNWGFSLTRVQQAATGLTHIHEMGHNMGAHHHKGQNFQPGPTNWSNWPENVWSAGWRWTGDDNEHYCDLMTYTSGSYYNDGITHLEVPIFSSPNLTHMNVPAGNTIDGDNARTLREVKHYIAAYRAETVFSGSTCPTKTMLGNLPDGESAYPSSVDGDIINHHEFSVPEGKEIEGVVLWGVQAYQSGESWTECSEEQMDFEIAFYDKNGSEPGNIVYAETLNLDAQVINEVEFGAWTVKRIEATVSEPVDLNNGYFSVASVNSPGCWFLNIESATGFGTTGYYYNDVFYTRDNPLSFCMIQYVTLPEVSTSDATNVTHTTAKTGGNVTFDGGSVVTSRGVVYSRNPSPTLSDNIAPGGSGTGSFNVNLSNLTPGSDYYVRAYATNVEGTEYGEEISFTTSANLPTITTHEVFNITSVFATSGGYISSDGGASVVERGVVYSKSPNPNFSDYYINAGSGTGNFFIDITDLTPSTVYYIRAYAINSQGTVYGQQETFNTYPVSVNETENVNDVVLYPNPAKNNINIKSSLSILEVRVYDVYGKLVYNKDLSANNEHKINLDGFTSGVYFLQLISKETQNTSMFQVQK